jgi:hypothetical protein
MQKKKKIKKGNLFYFFFLYIIYFLFTYVSNIFSIRSKIGKGI